MPDVRAFPVQTWNRTVARVSRSLGAHALDYCDPQGYRPLREEIARYLAAHRGVRCGADNVIVLTSSQQGLALISSLMLDTGDAIAVEDPGYPGVKSALRMAGATLVPIPVDGSGIKVELLERRQGKIRGVYVTPSHQYPTGVTLSLERRLRLIEWARRHGAWIVEDDYDSEYRYEGAPISCIQGLDDSGCVLYVGTFTKTLFPALRLAYLVVPTHLVRSFVAARTLLDGHSSLLPQVAVAEFMSDGHFTAHIRRMRHLYKGRRDSFLKAFDRYLGHYADHEPQNGGFHIACYLETQRQEAQSIEVAASVGIELPPLGALYLTRPARPGWVLGYVALTPAEAESSLRKLARALAQKT
ncbi:PLP-dependent aminotransferase family protein [Hyphomicrobium sp.]|uniref:MocR-like pyridoxine biosynthesis transcription factor PdxR n=1 Tax=Hyphomicrobium sp. TaxID=82 RepID=UPI002E2FC889|nr:PLP-dependent aminotransferase family protein [Hyphomicrobium sp.]HEX2843592.1 PLP-dependent aminotransferase family protein [Hyphomicrobium sp.]